MSPVTDIHSQKRNSFHLVAGCELWPMTLTFKYDSERVKVSQHAKQLHHK